MHKSGALLCVISDPAGFARICYVVRCVVLELVEKNNVGTPSKHCRKVAVSQVTYRPWTRIVFTAPVFQIKPVICMA